MSFDGKGSKWRESVTGTAQKDEELHTEGWLAETERGVTETEPRSDAEVWEMSRENKDVQTSDSMRKIE